MNDRVQRKTVVITEDLTFARESIRALIAAHEEFLVVGEAQDHDGTMKLLDQHQPDLLTLNLVLPGRSGLEILREIKRKGLPTKVLVFTRHVDEQAVRQAIGAGAHGCLSQNVSGASLLDGLRRIGNGEMPLDPKFIHLREEFAKSPNNGDGLSDPLHLLSNREREVFLLLAQGVPNRIIAKGLFISPRTVETHRARILKKLKLSSTADLIHFAIKHYLVSV